MKGGKRIYCPICDKQIGKYSRRKNDLRIPGWVYCPKHSWIPKSGKSPQHLEFLEVIFTVQVGSFSNASRAEALREKLKEKGYNSYITISKLKMDKKPYKIFIGKFKSREKAENLRKKIKKIEVPETFVTPIIR